MFANVKRANAASPLTWLSERLRRYESRVQLAWLPVASWWASPGHRGQRLSRPDRIRQFDRTLHRVLRGARGPV